ncbi:hypothetical protein ACFPVX_06255 [Cohnella faecalis]|uniref:DUF8042 domain-containing protein n=1 Tax=Cohnella faecalis TaxID=2315694 RepID=A0A398CFU8_9BACL|nr:hypothetical protein [Cohnella faecalis]RIE02066.1 hypothetical protein D3H35_14985 [Cohnella faecalis]
MQQELIAETLETMNDYVPKLTEASEKIAHCIQEHDGSWADMLIAFLEGVAWFATAVEGIQRLDQEVLANVRMDGLAPLVDQLREALEHQDFVSLCDLLQYEMKPLLQSYEIALQGVLH